MPRKDDDHLGANFQLFISSEQNGKRRKTTVRVDPEDVIAAGGIFAALLFAVAMVFGSTPINKYTVSIVGLSGGATAVSRIVGARKKKSARTPWIEWIAIFALIVGFGAYIWATWK